MDITPISHNTIRFGAKKPVQNQGIHFGSELLANSTKLSTLKTDTVSFGNTDMVATAETKMVSYIQNLLKEKELKPGQPLKITTDKNYIPFAKLMLREAYKMGSGHVVMDVIEPELERLKAEAKAKAKADGREFVDFEWKKLRANEYVENNALFIKLNDETSPYKNAKLTRFEANAVINNNTVKIPKDIQDNLKIIPSEILDDKLNIRPGQPVRIKAEREHEPNVIELAKYAYAKGSGGVDVIYNEGGPNDINRSFYEFANEKTLAEVPKWVIARAHEYLDKNMASAALVGDNPKALEGIDSDRITIEDVATRKAIKFYFDDQSTPWTGYYAPTTESAINSYPEYQKGQVATAEEKLDALKQAASEAVKINRVGKSKVHLDNIKRIADVINDLGIKELNFKSTEIDPKTNKPKTDLTVGIPSVSKFRAARMITVPGNQEFVPNCPTEEVFTAPEKTQTRGYVTATMPLSINGNIVDGIYMEFDDKGQIFKFTAAQNEDVFKKLIEKHDNAKMLGEVALVAGSPIFDLLNPDGSHRVFNSTLIDENAACHIAVGSAYPDCLEGADKITNPDDMKKFFDDNNINDSTTHVDFMIGGPNVIVTGIKENGEKIVLIKDNKFQV